MSPAPVMEISMLILCLKTGLCLCLHHVERHIYTILFNMVILCFKICLRHIWRPSLTLVEDMFTQCWKKFLYNFDGSYFFHHVNKVWRYTFITFENTIFDYLIHKVWRRYYIMCEDMTTLCIKTCLHYVWGQAYTLNENIFSHNV